MSIPSDRSGSNHHAAPIAIIGIGCIFPGARDTRQFWKNIVTGQDCITDVPSSHWSRTEYFDADPKRADHVYCTRGGFISPFSFDPAEFGIPPASLEATDTSQLLGLAAAKMALQDAGYETRIFDRNRTSVILGVTGTQELVIPLASRLGYPKWDAVLKEHGIESGQRQQIVKDIADSYVSWQENSFPGLLGNVVAGRICNRLDLRGTNCVVDAACASSFGAVHLAMMELGAHHCDMVITGGVDTLNDIFMHMCFAQSHILSASGDIRPFSRDADGTVLGEGIGMLVLKRMDDAIRDQDRIYAVIRGIGTASDGKSQSIYAPRKEGQEQALRAAYQSSGIDPASVGLIEAHGTGTRVGDQVEFRALNQVFQECMPKNRACQKQCALGSVKSMIGHAKAAAGAAGLIKTALSLYHKVLPPTLKAENPDPGLEIDRSPFYLNGRSRPWLPSSDTPRRAGVSAFGFGGSNFHLVLEEAQPVSPEIAWDGTIEMLAASGSNLSEIRQQVIAWKEAVSGTHGIDTLKTLAGASRKTFKSTDRFRLIVVPDLANDSGPGGLIQLLDDALDRVTDATVGPVLTSSLFFSGSTPAGKLAFLFPGQGSQYVGMGRDLMCLFPAAQEILKTADAIFDGPVRLSGCIYPVDPRDPSAETVLRQTQTAQPAIAAVSLSMLAILSGFGVTPDAVCGHSFGELPALFAAGRMDQRTLFDLSVARGRAMASARSDGAMLAVQGDIGAIDTIIRSGSLNVVLANRNSPSQGVVSGAGTDVDHAGNIFRQKGFRVVRLPVSTAFHSPLMADAVTPFLTSLSSASISPSDIPVLSNMTGESFPDSPESVRQILSQQLISPVNFVQNILTLHDRGIRTFLEVGPKAVLTGLVRTTLPNQDIQALSMDASSGKHFGMLDLARTLAPLAVLGHPVRLDLWQPGNSAVSTRKKAMNIPLSGANYRPPKSASQFRPGQKSTTGSNPAVVDRQAVVPDASTVADSVRQPQIETVMQNDSLSGQNRAPGPFSTGSFPTGPFPPGPFPPGPFPIDQALQVVQEGLRSLQTLQLHTAEAHKLFLQSQAETGRALQKILDQTRFFSGSPAVMEPVRDNTNSGEYAVHPQNPLPLTDAPVFSSPLPEPQNRVETGVRLEKPGLVTETRLPIQMPHASPTAHAPLQIETVLLNVVSNLTGYPVDTLGLDMDIEADLGIDSIKRVEILAAMEEAMPGLPSVPTDVMAGLKTLGQVAKQLAGGKQGTGDRGQGAGVRNPNPDICSLPPDAVIPEAIQNELLNVVSRLTGYPVDRLGLDMDIEADLGIDSIKRVEILAAMEEAMPELPSIPPDEMAGLKTLRHIVSVLHQNRLSSAPPQSGGACQTVSEPDVSESVEVNPGQSLSCQAGANLPRRQVVALNTRSIGTESIGLSPGRPVLIAGNNSDLIHALMAELKADGIDAVKIDLNANSDVSITRSPAGLILVTDPNESADQSAETGLNSLLTAFDLAHHFGPGLMESAKTGGALFASVTFMDGAFGFKGRGVASPVSGGLAGLVKTASLEWPGVTCRAVDISPEWSDPTRLTRSLKHALFNKVDGNPVEIGLDAYLSDNTIFVPVLMDSPYPQGEFPLQDNDVVVISGGARGVTAFASIALANRVQARLVLLGRSPNPFAEPGWLTDLTGDPEIKQAILSYESNGQKLTPRQIELRFRKYMANREIQTTLNAIKQTGSSVQYIPVDIQDAGAVRKILNTVRQNQGPIRAIVHGAGVIEDRLIIDKTRDQVERVIQTKVNGLRSLLNAVDDTELAAIVLFSSVTARTGNKGQADYAMANEVMNKIARIEAHRRPSCRVVSINWGPWNGGMVQSGLKKEFERNGVSLIEPVAGAAAMIQEMHRSHTVAPVEVVIGDHLRAPDTMETRDSNPPEILEMDKLCFKREIDINRYPILKSHVLGGVPVVPFALITEWLGHGALHDNPGLYLQAIENIRLFKGIRLEDGKKMIRLMTGKTRKNNGFYEIDVEIRDGVKNGRDIIHTRGKAVLTSVLAGPPAFDLASRLSGVPAYPRKPADVYEKLLFHGCDLQGIQRIIGLSDQLMIAELASAPLPHEWIVEPTRSRWISDPLVLDSAFQMATIWCHEKLGMVSLPSFSQSYRQYCRQFPSEGITAVLEIRHSGTHKMTGDFTFLDDKNTVVAELKGYEAVADESLTEAFHQNTLMGDALSIKTTRARK